MAIGLNVSIEEKDKCKLVRLAGRLDATTTPALEGKISKVLDQNKQFMLMDFSKVDYLSSAGMRLLLSATKKLKAHGGKLVFCSMSDEVMEIIKMAGFERILAIYPSEEAALKACG